MLSGDRSTGTDCYQRRAKNVPVYLSPESYIPRETRKCEASFRVPRTAHTNVHQAVQVRLCKVKESHVMSRHLPDSMSLDPPR